MSLERRIRELIRSELKAALEPIRKALRASRQARVTPPRSARRAVAATAERRGCAVIGCEREAISKGYCSAHYQKFRMLSNTGRLPKSWKAHAPPQSVENVDLPRGRAGAQLLAAARAKPKYKNAESKKRENA